MWDAVGLTAEDEQVYRELLNEPHLPVGEYARRLATTPELARRSLDRLLGAGLAQTGPDGPQPLDPSAAVNALTRQRRTALDRLDHLAQQLAHEYEDYRLRRDTSRLADVLEGSQAVAARMTMLLAGTTSELLALDAPPYVAPHRMSYESELEILARGVRVRGIYSRAALEIDEKFEYLQDLARRGEEARVLPEVPMKMMILDRTTAVLPLTHQSPGSQHAAIIVYRSGLCEALCSLFEALWTRAAPVSRQTPAREGLDDASRALLTMLGSGLKDDAIARHLGISERTLRRRITDLLEQLGATSRFQAGAQAVRRGWYE